ncbi:LPD38 domain-containing protein [Aquabacterium sp.]|uniref:LPD38 domain-containing protein n=1 Tax=Aquabacterium sp. TaxID=1872578 RepID=UPI0035C75494
MLSHESRLTLNLARGQLGEQFGEQLTTAGQYWVDGTPLGLDKPVSLTGYLEAARDTAIQTLIATGALQGAHSAVSSLTSRAEGQDTGKAAAQQAELAKADAIGRWQGAFAQPPAGQASPAEPAAPAALSSPGGAAPNAPVVQGQAQPDPLDAAAAPDAAAQPTEDAGTAGGDALAAVSQGSLANAATAALDERANQAATSSTNDLPEPTDAQKEAGNYAKGHVRLHGMDIAIENPRGSTRRGTSPEGVQWESTMAHHYGYIKGTVGNDKDHVDTFIGQNPDSPRAFVVDQIDPKTGNFDEHKVVLGADSEEQAREIYLANYEKGWQGLGAITELPMPAFKSWVKDGIKRKPLGDIATASAARQTVSPEAAAMAQPAPASPETTSAAKSVPMIAGKPVTDLQTGQLLRYAKMQSASERVRRAAADEVKRRETEAMWRQRDAERAAQDEQILTQARDEQLAQAVATSNAADLEAPSAMAQAFAKAKQKAPNESIAPQAPTAAAAPQAAQKAANPRGPAAAGAGEQGGGISRAGRGAAVQAAGVKQRTSVSAQDRYNSLVPRWNDLVSQYKAGSDSEKKAIKAKMKLLDAEMQKAKADVLMDAKRGIAQASKQEEITRSSEYKAMPIGAVLRPSEFPAESGIYWEKTGRDEWIGKGDWFQAGKTRTSSELARSGGLVQMKPQENAGDSTQQPVAATKARGATKATRARQHQQLDPEHDTLLQALAKLGGIRRDVVAGEFGLKPEELKHSVSAGSLKAYPFRKNGGMDMDQAITALAEAGYFAGMPEDEHRNAFERAIYDELGGSPLLTPQGQMRQAAQAYNDQQEQDARAQQEEDAQAQAELDAEREAIMAEAGLSDGELSAQPDHAIEIEAAAQDMAAGMRALGFTEQEIADELARQNQPDTGTEGSRAQDPEVANRQAQAPPAAGDAAPRDAGRSGRDAGAAPADAGRGEDQQGLTPAVGERITEYGNKPQAGLFDGQPPEAFGYQNDLFGNPLPAAAGKPAAARSDGPGVRGDAQPTAALRDTPAPAGKYRVRTIVGHEQQRKLGAAVVLTPAQAAQATSYLYRSAVERFDALITDKDGKPLAVVGSFKGAISQTSIYPGTVIAEAFRVPGAAHIWFSHNHPSGTASLSRADEMLNSTLSALFKGTAIKPMGILAVAGQKFEHKSMDGQITNDQVPAPNQGVTVPVVERELAHTGETDGIVLDSPVAARAAAKALYAEAHEPGLMLLDAQHRVAAWVPIDGGMSGKLMGTGGLDAVYRAVSEGNASSAIIVHGGELSAKRGDGSAWTIAQNLGAALRQSEARVLDIIDVKASRSAAETGDDTSAGSVFSIARDGIHGRQDGAVAPISAIDMADVVNRNLKGWRGIGLDRIIAVDHWTALPQEILQDAKQRGFHAGAIEGVVYRGRVYLVRENLRDVEHAERVLFHEVLGHLGVKAALAGKPTATLNALWDKLNGLAGVAKLAKKYQVGDGRTAWDRLQPYVQGTQEDVTSRRTMIIDELIAFLAQANDTSALTQFKGYMADVKGAIVALLRRLDLNGLAERLDRAGAELDVLQLVRDARQAIQRGKTRDGAAFVFVNRAQAPAFSGSREDGKFSLDNEGLAQARAFLEGEPIASLTGNEFAKDGTPLTVKVPQWYAANGVDKIDIHGLGQIMLDERAVKDSLSHGIGRAKSAAFAAVPAVLRNGMVIHEEAMRGNADVGKVFHIAAPIEIGGQPHVAAVLVKSDQNGRRMYVHEVVLRERLQGDAFKTEALSTPSGDARNGASPGALRSVLQDIFSVKSAQGSQFSVGAAPAVFNLPEFGRTGRFIEAVQNRYNRWKQAIDAVRTQGGTVNEANDFYSAEERYWGIVGAQLDDFKQEVKDFVQAVQADGLELSDVALYAYAKHAPERNARIAQINDQFPDGGSGMTNQQAADIIAKARADGVDQALERHAAELGRWTQGTRDVLLANGLISRDEFDAWSQGYKAYVPLRGKPGQTDTRRGTGAGFDIRGRESFRAMGRRSQAGDIIEHILQDRAKALMRAGKNEVLRRFARFVLDNPDPTLWEVNAVKRQRRLVETSMGEKVVEFDEVNDSQRETVAVKDAGQTIYIEVKDEELLKQLKNLHDEAKLPFIVGGLQWANRLLSRMYTSLSPVFTVLNGARDASAGLINMLGSAGMAGAGRMAANLPGAYREAFRGEVRGKPSAMYEEYRRTGGKTGFMDFKDIEGYAKELAQLAAESAKWGTVMATDGAWNKAVATWRKSRGTARKVMDRIEDVNGAVENATRFAAFKAAREAGKSVAEAASIAKNITVNFNRRGSMTPVLSAFFLFFNPAVQGTARLVQALGSRDVQIAMGGVMAGIFGLALANASMGGDDDDGTAYWDKIPDEVKERNLVIMLPPGSDAGEAVPGTRHGRYIKIPMPYGYNTFAVLAMTAADVMRHQSNPTAGVSAAKGAARVLKSFIGAWIPVSDVAPSLDNPKGIALAFVPDALDPMIEPVLNVNSFGKAMYPEGMGYDKVPDSEKVFAGQKNTWSHGAARWLNQATGGSQYQEGMVSLTPATINNLVRGYGGGVASFIIALGDVVASKGVQRDDADWSKAPFAKQLYGKVDMAQDQALAYEHMQQIDDAAVPRKRALKAGDRQAADAIVNDVGEIAKLGRVSDHARQQLTKIRKAEIRVIESTTMTDAEKNLSLRQHDQQRQRVYDQVNKAWNDAITRDAAAHQSE